MTIIKALKMKIATAFLIAGLLAIPLPAFGDVIEPGVPEPGPTHSCDYLIVVHQDLYGQAVQDLKARRQAQGFAVSIYIVTDGLSFNQIKGTIADYYNPAHNSYQLLYVLLIGNAVCDTADWAITNSSTGNFIPSYWEWADPSNHNARMVSFDEAYLYVDDHEINGSSRLNIPDGYIGRIPAMTYNDVASYIGKLAEYEDNLAQQEWKDNILSIAGDIWTGDPPGRPSPQEVRSTSISFINDYVPAAWESKILYYTASNSNQTRKDSLIMYVDDGELLITVLGTGADQRNLCYYILRESFDATLDLDNAGKYPFVYGASCDLGRFDNLGYSGNDGFFKNFLLGRYTGAIGWIAPTWATSQCGDINMSRVFYESFYSKRVLNIGRLNYMVKAKNYLNGSGVFTDIRQYNLYGDPGIDLSADPAFKPVFGGTGFELADPRVIQNKTYLIQNCVYPECRIIPERYAIMAPGGIRLLRVSGTDATTAFDSKVYWELRNDNIPLNLTRRFLSFYIYVIQSPGNLGHICLDGMINATTWLHSYAITDQFGQRIGPSYHTCPEGSWRYYAFDLSSIYGMSISKLMIGYDDGNSSESGQFLAYVDDIKFTSDWGFTPVVLEDRHPDSLGLGEKDSISVKVQDRDVLWGYGDAITYHWYAWKGKVTDKNISLTDYTAPLDDQMTDTVICTITDKGLHTVKDTMLIVVSKPGHLGLYSGRTEISLRCSPNPSNAGVLISYTATAQAPFSIEIYDILGRKIRNLIASEGLGSSTGTVYWDGKNDAGNEVTSGIYFCRLSSKAESKIQKLIMLK
jgi:hypothetical protein